MGGCKNGPFFFCKLSAKTNNYASAGKIREKRDALVAWPCGNATEVCAKTK
jgi:hypothetical protein